MNAALLATNIILARIAEAARDAESFEKPTEARSTLWHVMKIPQYGLWFCAGAEFYSLCLSTSLLIGIAWTALSLAAAYFVFEFALLYFRRLMK